MAGTENIIMKQKEFYYEQILKSQAPLQEIKASTLPFSPLCFFFCPRRFLRLPAGLELFALIEGANPSSFVALGPTAVAPPVEDRENHGNRFGMPTL